MVGGKSAKTALRHEASTKLCPRRQVIFTLQVKAAPHSPWTRELSNWWLEAVTGVLRRERS